MDGPKPSNNAALLASLLLLQRRRNTSAVPPNELPDAKAQAFADLLKQDSSKPK